MASLEFFTGITGATYQYEICDVNLTWNAVPGNYCFAKMQGMLTVAPLYFGQTENLAKRMANHNKLTLAAAYGATMVLAHVNYDGESAREAEERDLIRAYNPLCNVQHNPLAFGENPLFDIHVTRESPLVAALRRGKK